jgi:hypothetical protein
VRGFARRFRIEDRSRTDASGYQASLLNAYVSWWPSVNIGSFGIKGLLKRNKKGRRNLTLAHDILDEGYLMDHVIKLDTDAGVEARMQAEWNAIRTKKKASYGAFRKNCSTIVSRVLHAGGLHAFKWAEDNNWVWAPSDVRRLALRAGGTLMKWRDFRDKVLSSSGLSSGEWNYINHARSGRFCTCGAPVEHQQDGYRAG